ncbi:hypothetical protein ATCC90586_004624 [Pythium insidiosum]|nr:hypothetical protein ATCC90586_004624 [Pythium insidiosum]
MPAKADKPSQADKYAAQWSTHKYKMEYDGYLSNHLLHGIVALRDLKAAPDQIDAFANRYTHKLCTAALDKPAARTLTWDEAEGLLGKRTHFEALRTLYECEVAARGRSEAIRQHFPRLMTGLAGSLLHGIIQLGYGYRFGGELPIAEGLAYMHYSYLPFVSGEEKQQPWASGSDKTKLTPETAFALVQEFTQSIQSIADVMRAHIRNPVFDNVVQGGLQRRLMAFSADPLLRHDNLHGRVVATVDQLDLHDVDGTFAIDLMAWLYLLVPENDFVLVHGVTSAWALQQVEPHLSLTDRQRAWTVWLRVALSAFLTREVRELHEDVHHQLIQDDSVVQAELASLPSWDELVTTTLGLDCDDVDEHVYKFVQVMRGHAAWKKGSEGRGDDENGHSFFTPTQREYVARAATQKMLSMPLN